MFIRHISVFLENRPGQLVDVLRFMEHKGIDMLMYNLVETSDCGIMRVLVRDADTAVAALQGGGFDAAIKELPGLLVPDEPGAAVKVFETLSDAGINVRYSYAYALQGKRHAVVFIRVNDNQKAVQLLTQAGFRSAAEEDLF